MKKIQKFSLTFLITYYQQIIEILKLYNYSKIEAEIILHLLSSDNHKILNKILTNLSKKLIDIFHKENEFELINESDFFDEVLKRIEEIWKSKDLKNNWRIKIKIMEEISL